MIVSHYWDDQKRTHRISGPAIVTSDGAEFWYEHGKLHREGGPARSWPGGHVEYWLNGKRASKDEALNGEHRLSIQEWTTRFKDNVCVSFNESLI